MKTRLTMSLRERYHEELDDNFGACNPHGDAELLPTAMLEFDAINF